MVDAAHENRALDEYHNFLQRLKPEDQRNWLSTSGFMPDDKEVLIEAGIHCLPLLQNISISDAAASRLEAIIIKLKLLHYDQQARLAVEDFQAEIKKYTADKKKYDILNMGCLLAIFIAIIGVGWWLVWDFGWSVAVPVIVVIIVGIARFILKR